jgi:WD40 repeat protein
MAAAMAKLSQPPSLAQRWHANISDHVISLAWSPDGAQLAAASVSGPISLFDAAGGSLKCVLDGHGFGTAAIAWQPCGKLLASAGQDGKVRLWESGKQVAELDGGSPWVEHIAWNPRGEFLVSAAGKKLRLWNDQGALVRSFPDQPSTIADVAWSAKGKEFASAGYGGIAFWLPDSHSPRAQYPWKASPLAIAWSADGQFVAGGGQDSSVHFWYVKSGKDLEMTGYPRKVGELSWDVSSTYLATGGGEIVMVWNCSGKGPAGSTPISFELHKQPLTSLRFQNRGPLLASACVRGVLALWYPGGSKRVLSQAEVDGGISQLAWAPNDSRLAVGGETGAVGMFAI